MNRGIARWLLIPALTLLLLAGLGGTAAGLAADGEVRQVDDPVLDEPSRQETDDGPPARVTTPPELSTEVKIFVDVVQVLRVEERNNLFEVEAVLTAEWTDLRVRTECKPENRVYKDAAAAALLTSGIWAPDFQIEFGRGPSVTSSREITVSCAGLVTYQERFTSVVSQRFTELNDFPFDTHTIWFTIEPFGFSEKNSVQFVEFSPDDELITAARRAKSAGKLESEEWKFREQAPNVMGVPPSITTSLEIKRHTGFYWQNIILPLILIVSISCTVFWMRYQLHERLGVSITVLLTVVAFDFLTSDNLPRLAYTTRLDMFYNVSYVAVTLTIVFSVAATRWNSGRASDDDSDPGKAPAHGAPTSDATADELGGETSVPADPAEPFTAPDAAAPEAEAT